MNKLPWITTPIRGRFLFPRLIAGNILVALMGLFASTLQFGTPPTSLESCPLDVNCIWHSLLESPLFTIQMLIGCISLVIGLLVLRHAWRLRDTLGGSALFSSISSSLLVLLIPTGLVGIWRGWPLELTLLHRMSSVCILACAAVAFHKLGSIRQNRQAPLNPNLTSKTEWKSYLQLTKPLIVGLLLVTTLAGMILGKGGIPGFWLVMGTLLGGGFLAGGASALNQYIDRDEDGQMQRTKMRPLPSGELSDTDVLIFGSLLCIIGFYVLFLFVNPISGLLGLLGAIYYVLLYSLVLKRTTPQNIVVGGAAGAIPPLVGWAATTGSLDVRAFFLFALIFLWTPPHFWSLSLIRRKDYQRAGIPMFPVVFGDQETRKQILLYTIQVVALTVLMPLVDLGGAVYLGIALFAGVVLLWFAWRLWTMGGNRIAWGMYRYSSMYLFFMFGALILETIIIG